MAYIDECVHLVAKLERMQNEELKLFVVRIVIFTGFSDIIGAIGDDDDIVNSCLF